MCGFSYLAVSHLTEVMDKWELANWLCSEFGGDPLLSNAWKLFGGTRMVNCPRFFLEGSP